MTKLKTIILVEDDPFDAEMTQKSLKESGLANKILRFETGLQLLEYLESDGIEDIAVVILDLQMPVITGIEALEVIREKDYGYFPIVVLTSSRETPDIKTCYKLGVNSFVTKPVNSLDFQKVIQALGLYWGVINEPPPLK